MNSQDAKNARNKNAADNSTTNARNSYNSTKSKNKSSDTYESESDMTSRY
jgi:hypothetical protein